MPDIELNRIPSLDLRWLHPPKDITLPLIVRAGFGAGTFGGYYAHPRPGQYDESFSSPVPLSCGIIAINVDESDRSHWDEASVVAHEFRHHLQWLRGIPFVVNIPENYDWGFGAEFDQNVRRAILTSPTERDAEGATYNLLGSRSLHHQWQFDYLGLRPDSLTRLW